MHDIDLVTVQIREVLDVNGQGKHEAFIFTL